MGGLCGGGDGGSWRIKLYLGESGLLIQEKVEVDKFAKVSRLTGKPEPFQILLSLNLDVVSDPICQYTL
jgi:hypothetical protein